MGTAMQKRKGLENVSCEKRLKEMVGFFQSGIKKGLHGNYVQTGKRLLQGENE